MQTLTNVKRDVVNTIRQVVDVVSKYAGGALPEPARGRVKQFILHLPQRWANSAHRQTHGPVQAHSPGIGAGKRHRRNGGSVPASAASTAPSSPLHSPRVMSLATLPGQEGGGQYRLGTTARPTAGSAAQAAQRILTLATESLDMMRSVTGIFKETLDRADTYVHIFLRGYSSTMGINLHILIDGLTDYELSEYNDNNLLNKTGISQILVFEKELPTLMEMLSCPYQIARIVIDMLVQGRNRFLILALQLV